MFGAEIRARTLVVCALAGAVATPHVHASKRSPGAGGRGDWPRVLIHDPATRWALYGALGRAARWLEQPGCRGLFTAFRDPRGRPLAERLSDFGVEPGGYLKLIVFADGRDLASCRRGSVLAVTMPGSRVVFVCGREFTRAWSRQSRHAAAVPLHEALHSLGLAEDPPTSAEIDAEVLRRCGP
jgi:hypothetical protein